MTANNKNDRENKNELGLMKKKAGEFAKFPCPSCGKLVDPTLDRCPYCGNPLPKPRPPPDLDPKKLS